MQDFFKTIEPIAAQTDLQMHIKAKGGVISVIVIPRAAVNDPATGSIKPLTLSGTADEMDSGFLQAILAPLSKTAGIVSNIAEYEQGNAKLAVENAAAKAAQEQEKKRQEERKKKLQELTAEADKKEAEKQYQRAIGFLERIVEEGLSDSPQAIKDRIVKIKSKTMEGTIFSMAAPVEQPANPEVATEQPEPAAIAETAAEEEAEAEAAEQEQEVEQENDKED